MVRAKIGYPRHAKERERRRDLLSQDVGRPPQPTLAAGGFVIMIIATGVMIFNRRLRELH